MSGIAEIQRPRRALEGVLTDLRQTPALQLTVENVLAQLRRRELGLLAHHLADLVTRAAGPNMREPIARWFRRRRRDDLDRLRVPERARERRDAPVHLRTGAMQTD